MIWDRASSADARPLVLHRGDRIAQLVVTRYEAGGVEELVSLAEGSKFDVAVPGFESRSTVIRV